MLSFLSIETSGKTCSAALCRLVPPAIDTNTDELTIVEMASTTGFEVIAEYNIYAGNRHDKFLAELCRRLLADNDTQVADLAAVAVSVGPGSFTGLRIGLAVAKGLCFDDEAEQIKLVAVPTLGAIALAGLQNHPGGRQAAFLSVIHSHAAFFYCQLYDTGGAPISDIGFLSKDALTARFAGSAMLVGTNYRVPLGFGHCPPAQQQLTAGSVGRLGAVLLASGQYAQPAELQPLYVQDFVPR